MPKMKTNRGAAKRFKLTANGKVKHKKSNHGHILTKKTTKRKRALRQSGEVFRSGSQVHRQTAALRQVIEE